VGTRDAALDKSDGLRNLNALLGKTIEGVAWLIDHVPKLPGIGAAVSAGVNLNPVVSATRAVATLVGSGTSEKDRTSSGKVGDLSQPGAKGQAAATAGAAAGDDDIKRTLKATEGFKSQAQQIGELTTTRERLNKAVKESIAQDKNDPTLNGKPSAVTKELQGRVAGVNERIAAAQKKGAGGGNEPQQVLDVQLQQKIKAAQDALTTQSVIARVPAIPAGRLFGRGISLKDFYDAKRQGDRARHCQRNRGIRERAHGRTRAPEDAGRPAPRISLPWKRTRGGSRKSTQRRNGLA
jgi:hypothetical protein